MCARVSVWVSVIVSLATDDGVLFLHTKNRQTQRAKREKKKKKQRRRRRKKLGGGRHLADY